MQLSAIDREMTDYRTLYSLIGNWSRLGEKRFPDGTRWIGHTPYRFPEAYLHQLYSPLDETNVIELEDQLERNLPQNFRRFLKIHNGANLFDCLVTVDGMRRSWNRTDFDVAAQQPFSILTKNIDERPKSAPPQMLFIGSLGDDRELVGMWPDGRVVQWDSKNAIDVGNTYDSVFGFLLAEAQKAEALFDDNGRRKSDGVVN
jgi:SMI1 / KNR4 family (SUKH-1)